MNKATDTARGILHRENESDLRSAKKQLSFADGVLPPAQDMFKSQSGKYPVPDTLHRGLLPVTKRGQFVARHRLRKAVSNVSSEGTWVPYLSHNPEMPLLGQSLWATHVNTNGSKQEIFRAVNIPEEYKQHIDADEWAAASQRSSTAAIWADYFSCCREAREMDLEDHDEHEDQFAANLIQQELNSEGEPMWIYERI
eukprot:Blabericola_migrator_1__5479@NODE_279_length_10478_cov_145_234656_g167_i1_p6_GENE_NODE_279_length_10478_cov_145_234656_g167_i1NODE_279_length_10478_cov_145_234656_g167_i1_p6_ORF_typecomplete_len197_score27_87_NODE_279_length_10478_cov_145_234656_g167_i160806670